MAAPLHFSSSRTLLPAAAVSAPRQQPQLLHDTPASVVATSHAHTHYSSVAAAAAYSSPAAAVGSVGHSTKHGLQVRVAAAAVAAAAFPLPDPTHAAQYHSVGPSSSTEDGVAGRHEADADAFALLSAAQQGSCSLGSASHGWQISNHIRQSVEEAMKASGMTGMGSLVPLQGNHQQQQQQQQEEPEQQQHAAWQQLLQGMEEAEPYRHRAVHAAAAAAAATAAADAAVQPVQAGAQDSNSSSSSRAQVAAAHALTRHIQACKTVPLLDQLLQQHTNSLDHIHVSAAFVQLARIQRQQQQQQPQHAGIRTTTAAAATEAGSGGVLDCSSSSSSSSSIGAVGQQSPLLLLQQLQDLAVQHLPSMQSRHTTNILWSCASLGFRPSEPLLQGLLSRAQTLLHQGTRPQGFANTLWALGCLGVDPGRDWMTHFFTSSQEHLFNFQPQELSCTIWALAQMGWRPLPRWHAAFMAASAAKIGSSNAHCISNQMWGLAKLGLSVPEAWWAAATYAAQLRATEFSPAGLSQLLWAAGMLAGKQQRRQMHQQQQQQQQQYVQGSSSMGMFVGASRTPSSSSSSSSSNSSSSRDTQWLQQLLSAAQPQLQQYSSSALSTLLWSLAVIEHTPQPDFLQSCLAQLTGQADSLSAAAAANAFWSASKLGVSGQGGGVQQQLLLPVVQQLQQRLPECTPQHQVYVASALANFRQQHEQLQQQHVAAVDSSSFSHALQELQLQLLHVSVGKLQQFGLGQLCQLGRWLTSADINPDAVWVDTFLAAAALQLHAIQRSQQLLLLHTLAHWKVQPQQGWCAIFFATVTAQQAVGSYSAAHVGALLQACAAAGLQPEQQQLMSLLSRALVPEANPNPSAAAAVLTGLCSLGFRPSNGWLQQFWSSAQSALAGAVAAEPNGLAALAAALQLPEVRLLSLRPQKPFAAAYHAALVSVLPQLQPQQAATVLAGLATVHSKPKGGRHEQLLPGLMSAAARGLYSMSLQDVIAAWWALVELNVLHQAVPLQDVLMPPPAAAAEQQQQQHDQQWLQQQWQSLWLRRLFSSSCGQPETLSGTLSGLGLTSLLQLADCLGRLQQPVPQAWAAEYVAAVAPYISSGLRPHELHLLLCALPPLGGAAAHPELAGQLLSGLQPSLMQLTPLQLSDGIFVIQQAGFRPSERWLQDYVLAASRRLPSFKSRQLVRLLASMARLRFVPESGFLAAATEAAVDRMSKHKVAPSVMVELLWALTALRVRPGAAWFAKYEARLLERGPEKLDGQQLSRLGWCLAALQRRPGQVLMARWLAATEQQLPSMDGHSLADTLWACAMLDEQPSRTWLDAFVSASHHELDSLSSSSLVTLVWALSLLQHRPPADWMYRCFTVLSRCLDATVAAAAAAVAAAAGTAADSTHVQQQQQQQQQSMEALGPQQVTRVTWALASLDCQLPASLAQPLLQLAVAHVHLIDADSLAQLVWAWDRLDCTPDKQCVRHLAAAARARLLPDATESAAAGGLWNVFNKYSPSSGSSSSRLALNLPRPVAAPVLWQTTGGLRGGVGQQQLVLVRPGTTTTSSSSSSMSSRKILLASPHHQQQQQQQQQTAAAGGVRSVQELTAAAAAHGIFAQKEVSDALGRVKFTASRQQLLLKLHKLHADKDSSNSSSSSSSTVASSI